ncbi:hypothetical protein ACFL4O_00805 [bacterium]
MKKYFLFLSMLTGLFLLSSIVYAGFTVTPMKFRLTEKGNSKKTCSVWIKNSAKEDVNIKIYAEDFWIEPNGNEIFKEAGTIKRSCAKWISLEQEEMKLGAGENKNFRFEVKIPEGLQGTYWSMVFVEQTTSPQVQKLKQEGSLFSISAFQRIGIRVYETIPNTEIKDASIDNIFVTKNEKNILKANIKFQNNGNVVLDCNGKLEINNEKGKKVKTIKINDFRCYPDAAREITVLIDKKLKPGTYNILSIIDYGAEDLVAGEAVIEIK